MDSYSGQEEVDRERCASGSKRGRMAEVSEGRGSSSLPHGVVWFYWFPRFCGERHGSFKVLQSSRTRRSVTGEHGLCRERALGWLRREHAAYS